MWFIQFGEMEDASILNQEENQALGIASNFPAELLLDKHPSSLVPALGFY